jgi:hypothetical protein
LGFQKKFSWVSFPFSKTYVQVQSIIPSLRNNSQSKGDKPPMLETELMSNSMLFRYYFETWIYILLAYPNLFSPLQPYWTL